jgi:HPt (histidine-containing phosphotransfer) domain-containing protein
VIFEEVLSNLKSGKTDFGLELFITTVHGLKGALYNIGEPELAGEAAAIEKAGKSMSYGESDNRDMIASETVLFVERLRGLTDRFR